LSTYAKDVKIGETMDLGKRKFRMAFAVEQYYSPNFLLNDPAYVRWLFHIWGKRDGVAYETFIQHHLCTDEDYAEFYPITEKSKILYQDIRDDPKRDFYCIDWNDEENPINVYGEENDNDYQRLEIILMPCNVIRTDIIYFDEPIPECITDLKSQTDYM